MKKLLLSISVALSANWCSSQITFSSQDLQESGKTYVTKTDTITIVNIGSASSNFQSWDFSSLGIHYMSGPSFDLTTNTPYAFDYPNSDLYTYGPAMMFGGFFGGAPVNSQGMDNGYMFWRKDATGFWTEGFMADEGQYAGKKVYTIPQEMILGTPATLGSNYINSSEWILEYNDNSLDVDTLYSSNTSKTQECDAWGSLTTPTSNYTDVLRIHEYGIKIDSVTATLAGNNVYSIELLRDTFNNYLFVTNGIHYPLVIVKCDKNNLIRTIEYYYNQGYLNTSDSDLNPNDLSIYPNPSKGTFTFEINFPIESHLPLNIYNSSGKLCKYTSLQNKISNIDLSDFVDGLYYYEIQFDDKMVHGTLIKN